MGILLFIYLFLFGLLDRGRNEFIMINKEIPKSLKWVLNRAGIYYFLIIIVFLSLTNFKLVGGGLKARQLNYIRPVYFDSLVVAIEKDQLFDRGLWTRYAYFFETVAEYIPERADAFAMAGFCRYYLGDFKKAIKHYARAAELKPENFSFSYNLGKIYYRFKEYKKASEFFQKAVDADFQGTLDYILASKMIYWPILKDSGLNSSHLLRRLYHDQRDCYKMLMLSYRQLKEFDKIKKVNRSAEKKNILIDEILSVGQRFYLRFY